MTANRLLLRLQLPADPAGLAQALQNHLSSFLLAGRNAQTLEIVVTITEAPAEPVASALGKAPPLPPPPQSKDNSHDRDQPPGAGPGGT